MNIFRELPPTAGFPVYAKDFLSVFSKEHHKGSLETDFKNYLAVPYAQVTYSGTAAFYLILEALKELSPKKTVIIPSFICPLVPLAIKRAGFKIAVCDINKDNFNFDIRQLQHLCSQNSDVLAIVAVHLAGLPLDFEGIREVAGVNKIFIIEDCAQSLGAEYKEKKVGTLGDFSFFSLCRGKGLTIYEGGVLVTTKERYIPALERTIKRLVNRDSFSEGMKIFELLGYWIFYRPLLFWFAFRLPQVFWNLQGKSLKALTEYFTIDFPLHEISKARKLIGHITFGRLEGEINKQRRKAYYYSQGLKGTPGIKLITESPQTKSTYPFLTLVFDDPKKRKQAFNLFQNSGLGVFQVYAQAITDYDYLKEMVGNQDCPNARYLAEREITLTTSSFLRNKDQDAVIRIIKSL
jgi:perosamine synthetase